jgi:hypothetical protein
MMADFQPALVVKRGRGARNNKDRDKTEENHSSKWTTEKYGLKKGADLGGAEVDASEGDEQWMQQFKSLVLQDQDLHLSILRYEVSSYTSRDRNAR